MQLNRSTQFSNMKISNASRLLTLAHLTISTLALMILAGIPAKAHSQTWTLQWSDEFNGASGSYPNASNWAYDTGPGSNFGNSYEIETYCAPGSNAGPCVSSQPNAYLDGNGNLVLTAIRNSYGQWTSARMKTQGHLQPQYGRIEARMKLSPGDGFWPAFWLLGASNASGTPWPDCGEQDIIEWVQSFTPTTTSSTTHGPGYSGGNGFAKTSTFPNGARIDDTNYHIYGVIWGPNSIQYYRDSPTNVFSTLTPSDIPPGTAWPFNNPFYILLNLAIGNGNFPGSTDSSTPSTATMLVDYVRVYTASAARSLNGSHTLTPQNNTALRLDDQNGSTTSGNPIDVTTANGGLAQTWSISNAGVVPAGYYNLATEGANCLTAPTISGWNVTLTPCNGSMAQAWNAVSNGVTFELTPANNPNNCLDVRANGTASGTIVQVYSCNSGPNEQWAVN